MAKLGLGPKCSFQVSCTAVSRQTLGQAAANKVWGLHVSASPPSLGQPAGDGGREAEGKETWEMSGLAARSYAIGHMVLVSSVQPFGERLARVPLWVGLCLRDRPCCLPAPLEAAALWGRPGRALQRCAAGEGDVLPGDRSPIRPAGKCRGRRSTLEM